MQHDVRWKQRFQNFDRAVALLRDLAAIEELHLWLLERRDS